MSGFFSFLGVWTLIEKGIEFSSPIVFIEISVSEIFIACQKPLAMKLT